MDYISKSTLGDALFATLCACGHNIPKILAHLRTWLAAMIAVIITAKTDPDEQHQLLSPA